MVDECTRPKPVRTHTPARLLFPAFAQIPWIEFHIPVAGSSDVNWLFAGFLLSKRRYSVEQCALVAFAGRSDIANHITVVVAVIPFVVVATTVAASFSACCSGVGICLVD